MSETYEQGIHHLRVSSADPFAKQAHRSNPSLSFLMNRSVDGVATHSTFVSSLISVHRLILCRMARWTSPWSFWEKPYKMLSMHTEVSFPLVTPEFAQQCLWMETILDESQRPLPQPGLKIWVLRRSGARVCKVLSALW